MLKIDLAGERLKLAIVIKLMQVNKTDQEDIILFQKVSGGDFKALETLFNLYYKKLCQFIVLFVHEKDLAEEISADVFVNLWQKRNTIVIDVSVKSYVYSAAKYAALTHLRSRNRVALPFDNESFKVASFDENPEDRILFQELKQKVDECIAMLPPQCGIIFRLHRFDEMKYKEIADVLNISVKTVEVQMSKAIRLLNESIKV